jgi:diguanylate cyclase (GGDEF)-like protein
VISLRAKIDESERFDSGFRALTKVFLGLLNALPKAALPANPELSAECKESLDHATAPLQGSASLQAIDEAGRVMLEQLDEICSSNRAAFEERDAALKEVVITVSGAINSFKGFGERHNSSLSKVADGFESLARISDVNELRRQLHANVAQLRQSVEEMRRQSEVPVRQLEAQITAFQARLESARKGSDTDRLTGVGSRREAEKYLQKIHKQGRPACGLVFDIEGFTNINSRYGTLFGDKLLQALAHLLKDRFQDQGAIFRWGADEFLVIVGGSLNVRMEQCRGVCQSFSSNRYSSFEAGAPTSMSAKVASGAAEYTKGETPDDFYRRARRDLEQKSSGTSR